MATYKKRVDTLGDTTFLVFLYGIMTIIAIATIYPFWNTIAISLNDAVDSLKGGITILPRKFTIQNYIMLLSTKSIYHAAFISVARTILGVGLQLFCTAMLAYVLSRKEFIFKKTVTVIFILTMYFDGGLIPSYMLTRTLGLTNNFLVYIVPGLISAFNLIVMRTFMEEIPESFFESGKIDGAGDFRMFLQIMLPLSKPVLATIALFIGVGQWNSWFDTFIYCSSNSDLYTLQYELLKVIASTQNQGIGKSVNYMANSGAARITPVAVRATITIVVIVPIMFVYPFLQKHFVAGLVLGGVKE